MKSAIIVVEDNGKKGICHHSKKDNKRQDPSLWKKEKLYYFEQKMFHLCPTNQPTLYSKTDPHTLAHYRSKKLWGIQRQLVSNCVTKWRMFYLFSFFVTFPFGIIMLIWWKIFGTYSDHIQRNVFFFFCKLTFICWLLSFASYQYDP